MCFSATASFTSGVVLMTVGVYILKQVKTKSGIPFASIPLIFGIQQMIEGMVWLSFDSPMFHTVTTYLFVFIAYVFWPIFVPLSVRSIETDEKRKKILGVISIIGATVGIYLFTRILLGPVVSTIFHNSIYYQVPVLFPYQSFFLYIFAVCFSSLTSSSKKINIFGTATLIGFFIAHTFYPETSFSVWCFFSAALSIIILMRIKEYQAITKSEDLILG